MAILPPNHDKVLDRDSKRSQCEKTSQPGARRRWGSQEMGHPCSATPGIRHAVDLSQLGIRVGEPGRDTLSNPTQPFPVPETLSSSALLLGYPATQARVARFA